MKCYFCGKRIVAAKNRYSLFPYEFASVDERTCCKKCFKEELEPTKKAIENLLNGKTEKDVIFYKNGRVREKYGSEIFHSFPISESLVSCLVPGYITIFNKNAQKYLEPENKGVKSVFGVSILGDVWFRRK